MTVILHIIVLEKLSKYSLGFFQHKEFISSRDGSNHAFSELRGESKKIEKSESRFLQLERKRRIRANSNNYGNRARTCKMCLPASNISHRKTR